VHQLWPPFGDNRRTKLDVVLFHGLQLTSSDIDDAWTSTWTQRGDRNVCWPREWLAFDLGESVSIFSVSYNVHVETSPHDHVSDIADNLFQNFTDRRYEACSLTCHLSMYRKPVFLSVLQCILKLNLSEQFIFGMNSKLCHFFKALKSGNQIL